ncbi:MAG: hypothetical protein L0H84_13835 [Pseudonocardia sp.]|nr:hypothetical protein [Pseudonocardia sp.]
MIEDDKADFSTIYDRPDPGGYYTTLNRLDYCIPDLARPVVAAVHAGAGPGPVLDVCCSYGVNATLLRHRLDFAAMARHVASGPDLPATRRFLDGCRREQQPDVLGLDVAEPAVRWARATGLLRAGWAENLEDGDPSPRLAAGIADVSTICCTGGVGYVTATTFERVLGALRRPGRLHAVLFVLRVFDIADIADVFARHDLVTEQVPGVTFAQRRFADSAEAAAAVHDVCGRGLDPAGKEAAGWFHTDCFVARPVATTARAPLHELLRDALPGTS